MQGLSPAGCDISEIGSLSTPRVSRSTLGQLSKVCTLLQMWLLQEDRHQACWELKVRHCEWQEEACGMGRRALVGARSSSRQLWGQPSPLRTCSVGLTEALAGERLERGGTAWGRGLPAPLPLL